MTPTPPPAAPWEALVVCLLLVVAPALTAPRARNLPLLAALAAAIVATLFSASGAAAYLAAAVTALLHAAAAVRASRTGALTLGLAAVLSAAAGVAVAGDDLTTAFWLSGAAIALRAGMLPLHLGVASLCERAPLVQVQQAASTIALVFIHLRFVDHGEMAMAVAPAMVRAGAVATFAGALMTLVQRDLRGFYRGTTVAHGGMLMAALGTAPLGNFAAALLVAVTVGLALGGLGMMITALEARVGDVSYSGPGGRAAAFPRLAAAFAVFGGAGVGLPGTAGFVADDLLLHTLWINSPTSAVLVIVSAALLAVATLIVFAAVFLGHAMPSPAPDLFRRERVAAVMLLTLLVGLGVAPGLLLGPADAFLTHPPAVAAR
ncbi:MAG: proton-conducting transporter membrane subunit [Vicinamibacterales bacterium]